MAMKLRRQALKGGIHIPERKILTASKKIEIAPLPDYVIISVHQHLGALIEPLVKVGDQVRTGDQIGEAKGYISVPSHASVSGNVVAIEKRSSPVISEELAIIIRSDGKDTRSPSICPITNYFAQDVEEMKNKIQRAGILDRSGIPIPAYLTPSMGTGPIDTLILNGIECEPYLTADHRLMLERPNEIIEGAHIVKKILNCKIGYFAIGTNKPDAIALIQKLVRQSGNGLKVIGVNVKYPQGAEKLLIKTILNRKVPTGGMAADVGCMVLNVAMAKAIYDAVSSNKPFYEHVVTITGGGIKQPKNLLVRIGTPLKDIIAVCGGLTADTIKIIHGGAMTGIALQTLDLPVIKGTTGIVVLTGKEVRFAPPAPCIRCARCVDVCPMNLLPSTLVNLIENKQSQQAYQSGLLDCIECGSCSYICPSKIRHIQFFKSGKLELHQSLT